MFGKKNRWIRDLKRDNKELYSILGTLRREHLDLKDRLAIEYETADKKIHNLQDSLADLVEMIERKLVLTDAPKAKIHTLGVPLRLECLIERGEYAQQQLNKMLDNLADKCIIVRLDKKTEQAIVHMPGESISEVMKE